jgi:hypothetical protein
LHTSIDQAESTATDAISNASWTKLPALSASVSIPPEGTWVVTCTIDAQAGDGGLKASSESSSSGWGIALLAAIQIVAQLALISRGTDFAVTHLTIDDTFYYLQVAKNLWEHGFPSFDGTNPTNGLQLLWFWVVVILAGVFPGKIALLHATLIVCVLLNALGFALIWWTGRCLERPLWAVVAAACWLFLNSRFYLSGMENSLHALLCWCVVCLGAAIAARAPGHDLPGRLIWLMAGSLALLVWARVDSALLSVPLFAWLAWVVWQRRGSLSDAAKALALPAATCAVLALGLFWVNDWMGDTPLPITGRIRMQGYQWQPSTIISLLVEVFRGISPIFSSLPKKLPAATAIAGLAIFVATPMALWPRQPAFRAALPRDYAGFLGVLVAGTLIHLAYLAGLGGLAVGAARYQSPEFITFICLLGFVVCGLIELARRRWGARVASVALIAFTVFSLAGFGERTVRLWRKPLDGDLHYERPRLARWIGDNLPHDWRCAAWNAGELGYFAKQPFVNLDGLVNSRSYFERVLSGSTRMLDYLEEQSVDCVVDYDLRGKDPSVYEQFEVIRRVRAKERLLEVLVRKP